MFTVPIDLRRARASLFVIFFFQGAGFALLFSRLPVIKDRFALSDTQLSLLTLALPLLAGVATLVTGSLVRRLKSDILLRVAILAEYVALVAVGFSDSLLMLIPGWILMAISFGTVDATMNMKAVALQEKYGRSIVVAFYATYSFAGIAGAFTASASAAAGMSLGVLMAIVSVIAVVVLLATGHWLAVTRVQAAASSGDAGQGASVRVPWGPVLSIGIVLAATYFIESSAASWGAVYVRDTLKGSDSVAAMAFGFYSAAMLIGRISADVLIRKFGALTVARSSAVVALAGTALVVFAPAPAMAIAGFALAGLGLCVIAPLAFAAAGRIDAHGVGVARANSFTYVGFLLGAAVIGPVADMSGMRVAYTISMVLAVVVLLSVRRVTSGQPVTRTAVPGDHLVHQREG